LEGTKLKKAVTILLVLITFLTSTQLAEAASIIEKTSSVFSEPRKFDSKIRVDIKGATVKYLRHAKYTSKDQKNAVQVAQVKGNNITGFAYNCPGYYLTRAYSDSAGTKLVGYIRVQVVASDVTTKGCPAVSEAKPSAPPPVINKTHPIPEVDEPKNMVKDGQDYNDGSTGGGTKPPENPKETPQYLNEEQQCNLNNRNGVTSWEIKWADKHTSGAIMGPHCVDMSECMYTDKWYCKAPSEPPKTAEDDEATGVPPRAQYSELVDQEDFGSCGIGDTIENKAVTTQCERGGATSPPDEENGGTENGGEGGKEEAGACGELCKIFECPGWKEYLGTLYDVAAFAVGDVEPPPVPDLPRPTPPNIFDVLNDVDQRNPTKPTGQDGMEDTPFDATDVKNSAPEIPVREDPTGGFNIVDPLTTLPEDGSTAPRPKEKLEDLPYPGGSGSKQEGLPKPSDSGEHSTKVPMPKQPSGSVKPSDTGGSAKYPIP